MGRVPLSKVAGPGRSPGGPRPRGLAEREVRREERAGPKTGRSRSSRTESTAASAQWRRSAESEVPRHGASLWSVDLTSRRSPGRRASITGRATLACPPSGHGRGGDAGSGHDPPPRLPDRDGGRIPSGGRRRHEPRQPVTRQAARRGGKEVCATGNPAAEGWQVRGRIAHALSGASGRHRDRRTTRTAPPA